MKKFLSILLIAYAIALVVNIPANYSYYANGGDWKFSILFTLGITTVGVTLAYFIFSSFRKIKWTERPALKLTGSVLSFVAFGALLMVISIEALVRIFHVPRPSYSDYVENIIFSVFFSVVIGLIISGNQFLKHLKKSVEDNERLEREMVQSQFETLKNQVNPHFLFNSLNTLTVMIPTQPDIAIQFVEQMAKVFRYSLQYGDNNTIDIATELKVVRSYIFLNEQRFNNKLVAEVNINENALQQKVITQSLLMLVENAIKHNELSSEKPLTIQIYNEQNYLVVRNTLQPKTLIEQSTKMGLENIRKRYALSNSQPVVIDQSDEWFTVKLPILPSLN